jgi:hypothetical protein
MEKDMGEFTLPEVGQQAALDAALGSSAKTNESPLPANGRKTGLKATLITTATGLAVAGCSIFGLNVGGIGKSGESQPPATPPPSVEVSNSPIPTLINSENPTIVLPSATPIATPEITAAPEKLAPPIAGLHVTFDASGNEIYIADKINPYGLKENAVGGYFNENVKMENPDGTTTNGGLDLNIQVVKKLDVDVNKVPLGIDPGKTGNVKITSDNNGWHNIPRIHLAFPGETFVGLNVIADSLNFVEHENVKPPFTWLYGNYDMLFSASVPLTDQTARQDRLCYGQGDSSIDTPTSTDAGITNKAAAYGKIYGHISNSMDISITNAKDSRSVAPLMLGKYPVFMMAPTA